MASNWEWARSVEFVWIVFFASSATLFAAVGKLRGWRRPSLSVLVLGEEGVSYTLSYVLTLPIVVLFACAVLEATFLITAKFGSMYAAYAGARAAIVWRTAQPAELRDDRIFQAAATAMAPFSSSRPGPVGVGNNGAIDLFEEFRQAGELTAAYDGYSRRSAALPPPSRPYAHRNVSDEFLTRKYHAARTRIELTLSEDTTRPDGELTCRVTYHAPLFSPGMRRFFQTEANPNGDYIIVSDATLPREAAATVDGSLGIDYQSK